MSIPLSNELARAGANLRHSMDKVVAPVTRVLVVDDNDDLNFMLRERLTALDYQVFGASSGEEALQKIAELSPDLIFLDVSMPGMSGLDVLDRVRQQKLDTAVVMTTAFGSEQVAMDALRRGADDYLPKMVVPRELEAILERTVTRLRLNRQNTILRTALDEKRRQLEAELGRAAKVQAELLPRSTPELPGFELCARCVPARDVGGDFYDWQFAAPGIFNITLCDVMGKGMPAALLMATVRAAMRAVVRQSPPSEAMRYVVPALEPDLDRSGSLVTLVLGQLHLDERRFTFVDAGHGHLFLRRANGTVETLLPRGLPLGISGEAVYEEGSFVFSPGDALVMYSDGLVDARPDLSLDGPRLARYIDDAPNAEVMLNRLVKVAELDGPPPDDLTIVVLRCVG